MSIKNNIRHIREEIGKAAEKSNRSPEDVLLVAVTKLHEPWEINQAIDAGITDIGENKVQEIVGKFDNVSPVKWHLIGHLQTNKVKYIIDKVSMIHSVDSLHIAKEIDKRAKQHDLVMDILIQVNPALEESKFGVSLENLNKLIEDIADGCENVRIKGLMCIAPFYDNPEQGREDFRKVKNAYDYYKGNSHQRIDFQYLSMGMSNDFQVAIEEGANIVRVGTAIFGARDYR